MPTLDYVIVDAFTPTSFQGNPAGVVPHADELDVTQMQAIAAEFNLSETSFIAQTSTPGADYRLRWFTPKAEVRMCGHATLAAAHALRETGQWADPTAPLKLETLSGVLSVEQAAIGQAQVLWLRMPAPKLFRKALDPHKLAELCGLEPAHLVKTLPIMQTQDDDVIVPVADFQVLQGARPAFQQLAEFCRLNRIRGVLLTTEHGVSAAVCCQSRFFAPAVGIDEDPVTGSVHGPLGLYLLRHHMLALADGEALVQCLQTPASGRVGILHLYVRQEGEGAVQVRVGGQCVTTQRGQVFLE